MKKYNREQMLGLPPRVNLVLQRKFRRLLESFSLFISKGVIKLLPTGDQDSLRRFGKMLVIHACEADLVWHQDHSMGSESKMTTLYWRVRLSVLRVIFCDAGLILGIFADENRKEGSNFILTPKNVIFLPRAEAHLAD